MKQLLKIYSLLFVLVLFLFMLFITVPWDTFFTKDPAIIGSFLLNGALWCGLLFYELNKRAYSLLIIHWLFCFLFFFAIAFMQYMYGYFPWVGVRSDILLFRTNILLFGWTFFVLFGYKTAIKKRSAVISQNKSTFHIPLWLVVCLTVYTVFNTIYRITTGVSIFFAQEVQTLVYEEQSSAFLLLKGHSLQAFSFFAAVFSIFRYKQTHKGLIYVFICVGCLLISYFPGGMSRYASAVVYGGLLLTTFDTLHKNRLFILMLLVGFLVIFPFLNAFRSTSFHDVDIISAFLQTLQQLPDIWKAGDYDAYAMLTVILEHVQDYGITWGKQLLGVLLFWVPRTFWITKPIGTGAFVSMQKGWFFTNLSAPLPAEAIINVGRFGMMLWAFCVGWVISKLDQLYWNKIDLSGHVRKPFELLYPVLIMFFFFMNRGDLLSSTAYMFAYVVIWWVLCKFCKKVII